MLSDEESLRLLPLKYSDEREGPQGKRGNPCSYASYHPIRHLFIGLTSAR